MSRFLLWDMDKYHGAGYLLKKWTFRKLTHFLKAVCYRHKEGYNRAAEEIFFLNLASNNPEAVFENFQLSRLPVASIRI